MGVHSALVSKPKEPSEITRARAAPQVVPGLEMGLRQLSVHSVLSADPERKHFQTFKVIWHCGDVQGCDFFFFLFSKALVNDILG